MTSESRGAPNPARHAREATDRAVDVFADAVDEIVASEQFSAAVGWYMRGLAFTASAVRGVTHRMSDVAADWMNVPTRDQLTDVAHRLTRLELAVDDIEMNTETLQQTLDDRAADA